MPEHRSRTETKGDRQDDDRSEQGVDSGAIDRERIQRRAYERYQERGSDDGHDLDDWLEAERETREKR